MTRQERLKTQGARARQQLAERAAAASSALPRHAPPVLGHFADDAPGIHQSFGRADGSVPARGPAVQETRRPAVKAKGSAPKVAKTQLVALVADKTGLDRQQASDAVSTMLDAIVGALRDGQSVGLPGLGTLSVKATAARIGVRPGTREKMQIPAGKNVVFKASSTMKERLARK